LCDQAMGAERGGQRFRRSAPDANEGRLPQVSTIYQEYYHVKAIDAAGGQH